MTGKRRTIKSPKGVGTVEKADVEKAVRRQLLAIADATTSPYVRLKRWLGLYKKKCPACGARAVPYPFRRGDSIGEKGYSCGKSEQGNVCPYCLTVISVQQVS